MSSIDDELLKQQEKEEQEQERQQPEPEPEQEDNQGNEAGYNDNGNGKGKKDKDKDKKHYDYVQKYSETGLLAEAVIVGSISYFAVAEASNITLKRSMSIDDISDTNRLNN